MTEITVRAADSSLAMEEIQKKLGDDAFIISTRKTGGQIEIVATDEDLSSVKKEKPILLSDNYRLNSFSSILSEKVSNASVQDDQKLLLESDYTTKIDGLIEQLSDLKEFIGYNLSENISVVDNKNILRAIGFTDTALSKLDIGKDIQDIDRIIKKVSKVFVSGKSKHFDTSDIYLVVGEKYSGKSVFAQKFCNLMTETDSDRSFKLLDDKIPKKVFKAAKDLKLDVKLTNGQKPSALVIEKTSEDMDLHLIILEIKKVNPEAKISVIRTIPVGSSSEFLLKTIDRNLYKDHFIAFTKLDICDISVPEISALIEMNLKCLFFSGIDKLDEGLYFAKLSQIESFLNKKITEKSE